MSAINYMKTGQERMQHMEYFNIAIDGPAAPVKAPSQSWLPKGWGLYMWIREHVRSMALYFIRQGISPEDEEP